MSIPHPVSADIISTKIFLLTPSFFLNHLRFIIGSTRSFDVAYPSTIIRTLSTISNDWSKLPLLTITFHIQWPFKSEIDIIWSRYYQSTKP